MEKSAKNVNVIFKIKHTLTKNREAQSHALSHLNQLLEPIAKDAAGSAYKPPINHKRICSGLSGCFKMTDSLNEPIKRLAELPSEQQLWEEDNTTLIYMYNRRGKQLCGVLFLLIC